MTKPLAITVVLALLVLAYPALAGDGVLAGLDREIRALAAEAGPAVVRVTAERDLKLAGLRPGDHRLPEGFLRMHPKAVTVGSGFLVSADGLVVTASRVVADAGSARVEFSDGRRHDAEILGRDDFFRVALLRVNGAEGVTPLTLSENEPPGFGAIGVVLGSSHGDTRSISLALVTGTGKSFDELGYDNYVTLNADIRPGDIGGPVLDARGRVVGMGVAGPTGGMSFSFGAGGGVIRGIPGSLGTGYAVPARDLRYAVQELEAHGRVRHGRLGVLLKPKTVEVREVVNDMPAAGAGIQAGDRICSVGELRIDSEQRLRFILRRLCVDANVCVQVVRDGKEVASTIRLEEHIIAFDKIALRRRQDGFEVLGANERWQKAGLAAGDLIVAVGDQKLGDVEDWSRLLHTSSGEKIRLSVRRGEKTVEITVDR